MKQRISLSVLLCVVFVTVFVLAPFSQPPKARAMNLSFAAFTDPFAIFINPDPLGDCSYIFTPVAVTLEATTADGLEGGVPVDYIGWVVRDGSGALVEGWRGWLDVGVAGTFFIDVQPGWLGAPTARPLIIEIYDIPYIAPIASYPFFTPEAIRAAGGQPIALAEIDPAIFFPSCAGLPLFGTLPPADARVNPVAKQPYQTAAIYCNADGGVDVWAIIEGKGVWAFTATPEEIGLVGGHPDVNTAIDSGLGVVLYRLTSGEYQVNSPTYDEFTNTVDPNGYVFTWNGCGEVPDIEPPPPPVVVIAPAPTSPVDRFVNPSHNPIHAIGR